MKRVSAFFHLNPMFMGWWKSTSTVRLNDISTTHRGHPMFFRFISALSLRLAFSTNAAELTVPLPGHDDIVLTIPNGWTAQVRRPRQDLPPTVTVTSPSPGSFEMLITPIWPIGGAKAPTLGEMRNLVDTAVQQAQGQAVEQRINVQELAGSAGARGYYFSATDRQPEPGGYKYLTQGALMFKELRITFTILINGNPKQPTEKALEMLRTARRSPARGSN